MLESDGLVAFNRGEHHFESALQVTDVIQQLKLPMTVTLQVTRRCNLRCIYCSEDAMIKEPSHAFLAEMIGKLRGVNRVIIAGGEPTLRNDLADIADELARKVNVVAMASNVVLMTPELAVRLSRSLSYVDVTIDGKRETHDKIRGSYDQVLKGIHLLIDAGVEVSLVTVLLRENEADVLDVCRLANELNAKKMKILTPIRKGRGANIVSHGLETEELAEVFERVKEAKAKNGWRTRVTLTDWEYVNEGHAILVHPDGDVVASPVPSEPGCVKLLGNLQNQELAEIWKSYPFRENHVNKYLEETLYVC